MGDLLPSTKTDATGSKLGYYLSTFESVMNTWTPTEAADAMTLDYIFVQAKQMKIQLEKFQTRDSKTEEGFSVSDHQAVYSKMAFDCQD